MKANIFPVIRYKDARGAIDWLVRAFGFEVQAQLAGPDGSIVHAELRFGTGVVNLGTVVPPDPSKPWSVRQGIYVTVDDVDRHFDRAKSAGAAIVMPLTNMEYGSREYSARDLDGHLWGFGTYVMNSREGEPDIFPELRYPSRSAAVRWLADAFGFTPLVEIPGPDGTPMHAEMRLGGGVIFMNVAAAGTGTSDDVPQATSAYVDDPDAHFERAKQAGASIVMAPFTTHYGARSYWARDPEGFLWGFSTYRPTESPP